MQTLFTSDGKSGPEARRLWADLSRREFYDGELGFPPGDLSGVEFGKALQHPISVSRLLSRTPMTYRRSMQHIGDNRVGFRVIWFVKQGSLTITRSQGTCVVRAGEAGILDSNVPFLAGLQSEADSTHESFQAVIPPDLFVTHLKDAERLIDPFSLATPEGQVVQRLLEVLIDEGERLSKETAKLLVLSTLEAIAESIRASRVALPQPMSLVNRRLKDIENYILMNLTDPDLCYDKVAERCGISPRYLCYLLKARKTSFSELVWKNRLAKAREGLIAPATVKHPISQIAYMCGFKSAAHFSRMFKADYGCSPREFRDAQAGEGAPEGAQSELMSTAA
ncbi:MAG: AraC family transcriptional regulator [Pseudomonadota bacterium]|nr:AraC family transcriptional regulator [Pseudomonadota bacterium]